MADNNGIDLNLTNFDIKQEYSIANINIEDVDYEEIIKTETEVVGESLVHQNVEVLHQNEDGNLGLGNAMEFFLNKNSSKVCGNCNMEYTDYRRNCEHLRAMRSIPKTILEIKGSLREGYGVYALKSIPAGVMFGPCEGLETVKGSNKYFWKFRYAKLIETNSEDYCNWMRFINCATTQSEQNLIALQFIEKLYYKTLREIKIGEELLIYYSEEIHEMNENIFKCSSCCFEFSAEKYLVNHNRVCLYKKEVLDSKSSTAIKDFEGNPKNYERINNLRLNRQKDAENEKANGKDELDEEGKGFQQDCIESVKINDKEKKEKLRFSHSYKQCLTTDSLKKQEMVHQKECNQNIMILNYVKGKKQKSEGSDYLCETEKKYECNYAANKLTLKRNQCRAMEKPYKCNECCYATVRKGDLLTHIKSRHTKEKPYKCNECSYTSALKKSLLLHIKRCHTVEKHYKCNECSYATIRKGNLLTHIKSRHTMEKPYKCNECSFATARKANLPMHIKSCHVVEKPYKCKQCSYASPRKSDLLIHIKSRHTMEKPYKCNECSYATVRKGDLLNHIKSRHTTEKPYKCNECSYTSARKGDLLTHIKSRHTTEKPYKCNECSFASARKDQLLIHIKCCHITEKPYKCNECSYTAVLKGNLLSHIKSHHTMEKHYKCNKCSYAAIHRCKLLSHIKSRHTIEKPYKCNECSYTVARKCELLIHIKSQHTMEKPL